MDIRIRKIESDMRWNSFTGMWKNSRNRGLDMESRSMVPRRLPMSMMPLGV